MLSGFDERGQAIQIGAVLLFGILVVAFASYQAFVVPTQNERVEFNHNQQAQQELQEVRNAIVSSVGGDNGRSVAVSLGTRYPSRLIAQNPGPATGSLRTVGIGNESLNLTVRNATADGETGDFWNGTARTYDTGALDYVSNYNVYESAPTTSYAHTVLFNHRRDRSVTVGDQLLIDERTITLVSLNGSLSRAQTSSYTVNVRPVSSSDRVVSVMNESHPLTLTAPTRLSESEWRQLLTPEPDIERSDVTVDPNGAPGEFGLLEITLPADTEYDLRMAKVGVGSRVRGREAAYVTDIEGGGTVTEGGSDRLVVEVRDRYNNPISGVTVNASTDTDDSVASLAEINATTDDDGRAEFVYRTKGASVNSDTRDFVNVSITRPQSALNQSSFDGGEPGDLSVEYTVTPQSGSTNQASYDLFWTDTTSVPGPTGSSAEVCDSFPCNVTLQATTDPAQVAAPVGFGTGDSNLVRVLERLNATQSGVAGTTVQFRPSTGNTTLVTQSGGTSDTLVVSTPSAVDFESGLGDYGVFGNFEGDDPEQSSQNSNSGSFAVVLEGGNDGGIVTTGYDTTGGESVVLQYWVKESDVGDIGDGNGGLRVEYLTGSGSWVTADSLPLTGTNPGEVRTARLGSDAIHDNFSLRFRQIGADNANDEWLIDNPTITALGTEVGPGEPGGRSGGGGGGNGDTTPPTVNSAEVTHFDGGASDDALGFGVDSNDASGIDRIVLTATRSPNDNQYNQRTITPTTGSVPFAVLDLGTQASFNGANGIGVTIDIVDTNGNVRTCTGTIDNEGGSVSTDNGGLTCN